MHRNVQLFFTRWQRGHITRLTSVSIALISDNYLLFLDAEGREMLKICADSQTTYLTRMHSSRMRTGRSLTYTGVCFPGGGCVSCPGGCMLWVGVCSGGRCAPWGMSAPGGVCSGGGICSGCVCSRGCLLLGGVCSGGGIPACTEADTPP